MAAAFKVRFLRGSQAANAAHTGPAGEITIDTENWRVRLHDGLTPGGVEVPNFQDVTDAIAAAGGGGGGGAVDSVNGQTGVVTLTAADVGLDNVDNFVTAGQVEMEAGDSATHFVTPVGVTQFMNAMGFVKDGEGEWVLDHGTIAA